MTAKGKIIVAILSPFIALGFLANFFLSGIMFGWNYSRSRYSLKIAKHYEEL